MKILLKKFPKFRPFRSTNRGHFLGPSCRCGGGVSEGPTRFEECNGRVWCGLKENWG